MALQKFARLDLKHCTVDAMRTIWKNSVKLIDISANYFRQIDFTKYFQVRVKFHNVRLDFGVGL